MFLFFEKVRFQFFDVQSVARVFTTNRIYYYENNSILLLSRKKAAKIEFIISYCKFILIIMVAHLVIILKLGIVAVRKITFAIRKMLFEVLFCEKSILIN